MKTRARSLNGELIVRGGSGGGTEVQQIAHLDPVAKTECNHPEGLVNLCANHHTKYDNGRYGPDKENADFVKSLKTVLHLHKRWLWALQDEVGRKLFLILAECERLDEELKKAKTPVQTKAIESVAKASLAELPKLAPVSHADPNYAAYKAISADLKAVSTKTAISVQLRQVKKIKQEYVAALGYVACPLCKASGSYDGADCPVCGGDREIAERAADQVDLADFAKVECPLCHGGGKFNGKDCPECAGECNMQRRFAENIDTRQHKKIVCPLCKGGGQYDGDDCPECRGDGEMPRYAADQVDVRQYKKVKCPLCEGSGQFDGDNCPECQAEGEMPRGQAENVDLTQYKKVICPLCLGRHDTCRFCDGEGKVYKGAADSFDPRDYR